MSRVNGFDHEPGYDFAWGSTPNPDDRNWVICSFAEDGVDVARALVNIQPLRLVGYPAPVELLKTELDYFEVHKKHRGRGVGRQVTSALVSSYGQLYALSSPDAVDFYRAIGWTEFIHEDGRALNRAELFISP